MFEDARRWGLLAGGFAAGAACILGLLGTTASAEPTGPVLPAPATVTQTVTAQGGAPAAAAVAGPNQLIGAPVADAVAPVPAPPVSTIVPAASQTITDYLRQHNVGLEAQKSTDFKALN